MKILIPVCSFGNAGGFRVLSNLANNWVDMGHKVDFVTYYLSKSPYYPTKANIIYWDLNNNRVMQCDENCNYRYVTRKRLFALYNFLKLKSKEYDFVIGNHNLTTYPIIFGSRIKNIHYIQAYEPDFYKSFFLKLISYLTYFLNFTRIGNADIYRHYKNIKCDYIIPPGLDLNIYAPKLLDKCNKDKIVVGCIGRKEEWKGSNDVGKAIKILRSKGYNVIFKVAFQPLAINDVEYILEKPDGDSRLADFYRSLDVLVAPGQIQLGAIHYPVIEAMACKVPVITTGYYPANAENSFIVPVKSPDKIAESLIEIINNYEIAYKKAELAFNEIERFDWKIVSRDFIQILESLKTK